MKKDRLIYSGSENVFSVNGCQSLETINPGKSAWCECAPAAHYVHQTFIYKPSKSSAISKTLTIKTQVKIYLPCKMASSKPPNINNLQ